jgi:hypothetical protein
MMVVVALLLLILAFVGHVALFVLPINLLYGTRFRGWWVSGIRWVCKGIIVAGPIAMLVQHAPTWLEDPSRLPALTAAEWAYLTACWLMAGGVVVQTVLRQLRRVPTQQLANHTTVFDVARALGRKPYGHGKGWWLARFPGNQIFQVEFVEKSLAMPQLPAAWEGLSILQLTDLHLCGIPDRVFYQQVIERCVSEPPDLVALTGDLLDSDKHYNWLSGVLGKLRWKIAAYAILGNHDSWLDVPRIKREVQSLGIEMVGGRWLEANIRGEPLLIVGNESPWLGGPPDLAPAPPGTFRLCLSHSPDQFGWAQRHGIDLMLAGHNHGGQARLPLIGPVLCPSLYSRRYDQGLFYQAPTLMYVSRGLAGTYPLRWNCRPEVTRIVLHRSCI